MKTRWPPLNEKQILVLRYGARSKEVKIGWRVIEKWYTEIGGTLVDSTSQVRGLRRRGLARAMFCDKPGSWHRWLFPVISNRPFPFP